MKQFKLFMTLLLIGLFSISCGDDDDGSNLGNVDCNDSIAVNQAIADEVDAIAQATTTWANDMTEANCQAVRDAYQAYIDELKNFQDCANQAGVGAEFAQSLADAEIAFQDWMC